MDEKNIQAYPLCWPDGWRRTIASSRSVAHFNRKEWVYVPSSTPGGPSRSYQKTKDLTVTDGLGRILESLQARKDALAEVA